MCSQDSPNWLGCNWPSTPRVSGKTFPGQEDVIGGHHDLIVSTARWGNLGPVWFLQKVPSQENSTSGLWADNPNPPVPASMTSAAVSFSATAQHTADITRSQGHMLKGLEGHRSEPRVRVPALPFQGSPERAWVLLLLHCGTRKEPGPPSHRDHRSMKSHQCDCRMF